MKGRKVTPEKDSMLFMIDSNRLPDEIVRITAGKTRSLFAGEDRTTKLAAEYTVIRGCLRTPKFMTTIPNGLQLCEEVVRRI